EIAARVIGPTTYGQLTGLLDPLVVEYGFGDPQERPRVSEQDSETSDDPEEEGSSSEEPAGDGD
ncbi:TlpA family protein disulfide reductase, partial [Nocardiopsis alba]